MWSVNDNVWKIAPVCGDAMPHPKRHAGMSRANQAWRKLMLRRRHLQKHPEPTFDELYEKALTTGGGGYGYRM